MSEIKCYLMKQRQEMLSLTKKLVNIDTPAPHLAGIQQAFDLLADKMHALGMKTRQLERGKVGTILIGETVGDKKLAPVILSGHVDTVFPVGTVKKRPFKVVGDQMHGPGVYDMKAGLVIGLFVIQALRELALCQRPLKIIILSDEEKLHLDSDAAMLMANEVKGGAYGLNLEGAAQRCEISTHQRGGMIVDIEVCGRAAHSGAEPQKGRSAIVELAAKILKLEALTDLATKIHVNCGLISGGTSENIIPDRAKVSLGVRFKTERQRQMLCQKIEQIAHEQAVFDTTANVYVKTKIASMEETPAVKQLFCDLAQIAPKVGLPSLVAVGDSGASDAGIMVTNGVPCVDGVGVVGAGAHTAKESASVASLVERANLLAELIVSRS